jgi:hypothetical protein
VPVPHFSPHAARYGYAQVCTGTHRYAQVCILSALFSSNSQLPWVPAQ